MYIYPQILLWLLDVFQNTTARKYYNFYRSTLTWSREEIKQYQFARMKDLLKYAQNNVPYYRSLFDNSSFNIDKMNSILDIREIPPLTRNDIQNNTDELVTSQLSKDQLYKSSSSGTTGIPITYYEDKRGISAGVAAGYFAYSLSGWQPGDKSLHIWGNPTSVEHWKKVSSTLKRILKNQTNIASTEFNDPENLKRLYDYVYKNNFTSIDGYTTAIYELARFIDSNKLLKLSSKFVFTTAENLTEIQKEVIQNNIGPVSDLYGCGEINGIAIQPINEDKYFIIEPHVYVEVEENVGTYKNILVTDLDNYSMPLIRYKVGDLIDGLDEPDEKQILKYSYFKRVLGRDSDIIDLPNGKKILPVNIVGGTLFRKIGGVLKHKVVWHGGELMFYFEVSPVFNKEKAMQLIQNEFKDFGIVIRIEIVEKLLPGKNGKYKYFEKLN